MKHSHITSYLLLPALIAIALMASGVTAEQQRKSRFFTAAAMQAGADNRPDESFELYRRAYSLDPDNLAAGYNMAVARVPMLEREDTTELDEVFALMRRYVDAYPADTHEGEYYAYLSALVGDYPEALRVSRRIYSLNPSATGMLPTMAGYYMQLDELDSTLALYNRYEELEGPMTDLYLRKVLIYVLKQDTLGALQESGAMIRNNPADPEGYVFKASMMDYVGFPDSTLFYLQKAEEIAPDYGPAKLALTEYYGTEGDSVAMRRALGEALMLDDIDIEDKLRLLTEVLKPDAENYNPQTDSLLTMLRDRYPHEPVILDYAAGYAASRGAYDEAADRMSYAVDLDPENSSYRLHLLSYLMAADKKDEAVSQFEKIPADLIENTPTILFFGATAYSLQGHPDSTLSTLTRMIRSIAPDIENIDSLSRLDVLALNSRGRDVLAEAYTMMGDTYYQQKNLPAAFRAYDNALLADPDKAATLNNYAFFLCENGGDLNQALRMSEKANEVEPGNTVYIDTYAWVLYRLGRYDEALKLQQAALDNMQEDEENAEYYDHMGDILFMTGDAAGALEMWKKALELTPDDAKIKHKVQLGRLDPIPAPPADKPSVEE